jgi:hypothetical protein
MRAPRVALTALFIALAPGAYAAPVFAQAGSEDAITTMARARFKEGVEFYDKGEYEQARAAFLQAYALKKHPAVLLNLAWSSLKSGHVLEGKKYFEQFLNEAKDATDKQRADANDGLSQAKAKLGRIDIQAPSGTDVMVDGDHTGTAPISDPVYVDAGAHTVKFKGPDGTTDTESVSVLAGQKAVAKFSGPSGGAVAGAAPPPSTASNTPAPSEPAATPPSPPEESNATPAPAAKETAGGEAHANLLAPPKNVVPAAVMLGIGVAGFATAAIMYFVKQSAVNNQNDVANTIRQNGGGGSANFCDNPPTSPKDFTSICNAYNSDVSDVNADATVGNIAAGVGVAGVVGAVIYWLVADKEKPGSSAFMTTPVVTPHIGHGGGGLSLSAQF